MRGPCRLLGFHSSAKCILDQLDGVHMWKQDRHRVYKFTILLFVPEVVLAWTCVLCHDLAVGWTCGQLGTHQGTAWRCRMLWKPCWFWVPPTLDPAEQPQTITLPPPCLTVSHCGSIHSHPQRCCVINWRFEILIHQSIILSISPSGVHWPVLWPSWASLSFSDILAMAYLLQLVLSNLQLQVFSSQLKLLLTTTSMKLCLEILSVSRLSCKWTLRILLSNSAVALALPHRFLSEFPPVSDAVMMARLFPL